MADPRAQLLDDLEIKRAVKRINDRFVRLGKGTPIHEVKSKLGAKRSGVDQLLQERFLQVISESYFPTLLSIQIEDADSTQRRCHECTTTVLNALKRLYEEFGTQTFNRSQVFEAAKQNDRNVDPEAIKIGMLFATDFSSYRSHWGGNEQDGGATSLRVGEGIIDFKDFQSAWAEEQRMRGSDAAQLGFISRSYYQAPSSPSLQAGEAKDTIAEVTTDLTRRNVFVIHGRNLAIRDSIFALLRALDLNPMEWGQVASKTGQASPYVGEILTTGFALARAVVAVLTPDDLACLHSDFVKADDPDYEIELTGQARPNVLFETGMALASHPERTILMEIGKLRPFSDVAGRYSLKFDGSSIARHELAERLRTAGCEVNTTGKDWLTIGNYQIAVTERSKATAGTQTSEQLKGPKSASIDCIEVGRYKVEEPSSVSNYYKIAKRDAAPLYDSSTDGVLAAFRISDDSTSKYAKLTARIDFIDDNGTKVERIDCGAWIANGSSEVSIGKVDTMYLIVAARERFKNEWVAVDNNPVHFGLIKKPIRPPVAARVTLLIDEHPVRYPDISLAEYIPK